MLHFGIPMFFAPHKHKSGFISTLSENIVCLELADNVFPFVDSAYKHEIGSAAGQFFPHLPFFGFRQGEKILRCRIASHPDFVFGKMVCLSNITFAEFGNCYQGVTVLRILWKIFLVVPAVALLKKFRKMLEIDVMYNIDSRDFTAQANKSFR